MSRCTPGHGWTRRAKRFGGQANIDAIRAAQYKALGEVMLDGTNLQKELAPHALEYLNGSPVRVLGTAPWWPDNDPQTWAEFFGWVKPEETPADRALEMFLKHPAFADTVETTKGPTDVPPQV